MFTGIIEATGRVAAIENRQGDARLRIATDLDMAGAALGDSIATNGVCLTVVSLPGDGFAVDVSSETLALTTIGQWQPGDRVNLEQALLPTSRFGGHFVSGHIDGVGMVVSRHKDARSERFVLRAPEPLAKYIAHKGSIAVDGASLTVNKVDGCEFELNIIPHTLEKTVINGYQPGTRVNLEVDLIARYLERMLQADTNLQQQVQSWASGR